MKKILGVSALLALILVACPGGNTNPNLITGQITPYSTGAGVVKLIKIFATTPLTTGTIDANGNFSITLPDNTTMDAVATTVQLDSGCTATPADLKIASTYAGIYANASSSTQLGSIVYGAVLPTNTTPFPTTLKQVMRYYADKDATITGTCANETYNLNLKRGWNKIYRTVVTPQVGNSNSTYTMNPADPDMIWRFSPSTLFF